jgi:hypothetical protein
MTISSTPPATREEKIAAIRQKCVEENPDIICGGCKKTPAVQRTWRQRAGSVDEPFLPSLG